MKAYDDRELKIYPTYPVPRNSAPGHIELRGEDDATPAAPTGTFGGKMCKRARIGNGPRPLLSGRRTAKTECGKYCGLLAVRPIEANGLALT